MKKLLATLAVAPLAITACGGGDSSSGGSSANVITMFGRQYTQADVDALFANEGAKVKEMIKNAGASANIVQGLGFKTTEETSDTYSFTNVDGSTVTEKIENDAFNAFATAAKATKVSATPASWKNALKIGQHQKYGTSAPGNGEVRDAADYNVKALGAADVNTVLSIPALANQFSAFSGTTYSNGLAALTGAQTPDHTEAQYVLGTQTFTPVQFQTAKDHDLGSYVPGIETSTGWHVGATGSQVQHVSKNTFSPKLQKNTLGTNDWPTVTHSGVFTSWYIEDTTFLGGGSFGNAWGGGWINIKFANFKADGSFIRDIAQMNVPKFKGSGATNSEVSGFYKTSLLTPLNATGKTITPTVKTAGSAIVDPGYAKGVALHNPAADNYIYFTNDLAATTNLPDLTNLHFSHEGPVKAAFKAWLNASTFGTVTKGTKTVKTWEWYGALVDPVNNGTGWSPVKFSSEADVYKNVCIQAQAMYMQSAKKTEATWTCPTA